MNRFWYDKAYYNGSNDIQNYVTLDSQRCISLRDIRRIYDSNNYRLIDMLRGHLFCPECKHAKLFYKSYMRYGHEGFLQRMPKSKHLKGCSYDRHEKSHKIIYTHYGHIDNSNAGSLLKDGLMKDFPNSTPGYDRNNTSSNGNNRDTLSSATSIKDGKTSRSTKYRFLKWNHTFHSYDDGQDCILYGVVHHIDIIYKPQPYQDNGVQKYGYKTIIDINNGARKISMVNWNKDGKQAKGHKSIQGRINFAALCVVHYPFIDLIPNVGKPYAIHKL